MRAGPGVAPGEARRRPHASVRETEGPLRPGRRRPPHSPRRHFRRIRKGTPAGPAPPSTPPVLSGHDPAARPPPRLARRPNARARAPRTLTGRAAGAGEAAAEVTTAPGSPNTAARRWGRAGGAGRGRAERQGCQVRQVRRRVLSAPRVVTAYPGPPGAWMERRPGSPEAFSGATRVSLCLSPERCPPPARGLESHSAEQTALFLGVQRAQLSDPCESDSREPTDYTNAVESWSATSEQSWRTERARVTAVGKMLSSSSK